MAERYCAERLVYQVGQRTIINNVSLALSPGEMVALIGPNGAGKSTLLRLLTGYLTPSGGQCNGGYAARRGTRKSSHAAGQ